MSDVKCKACHWTGDTDDVKSVQASVKGDDWLDQCPDCRSLETMDPVDGLEGKFTKVYGAFGGNTGDRKATHIAFMCYMAGYGQRQDEEITALRAQLAEQ